MLHNEICTVISTSKNIVSLIFVQDGALAHFPIVVRELLNAYIAGRWISRRGSHQWPIRNPDLAPCDFSLELFEGASLHYQTNNFEGRIGEIMSSILWEFLVESASAVLRRHEKLVTRAAAFIELLIKLHTINVLLIFIFVKVLRNKS